MGLKLTAPSLLKTTLSTKLEVQQHQAQVMIITVNGGGRTTNSSPITYYFLLFS